MVLTTFALALLREGALSVEVQAAALGQNTASAR